MKLKKNDLLTIKQKPYSFTFEVFDLIEDLKLTEPELNDTEDDEETGYYGFYMNMYSNSRNLAKPQKEKRKKPFLVLSSSYETIKFLLVEEFKEFECWKVILQKQKHPNIECFILSKDIRELVEG